MAETKQEIPETLRMHQEMALERTRQLERLGTLNYGELIKKVNNRNRWKHPVEELIKKMNDRNRRPQLRYSWKNN